MSAKGSLAWPLAHAAVHGVTVCRAFSAAGAAFGARLQMLLQNGQPPGAERCLKVEKSHWRRGRKGFHSVVQKIHCRRATTNQGLQGSY